MRSVLTILGLTAVACIATPAVAQPPSESALDARERTAFEKLVQRVEREPLTPPTPRELADDLFDRWRSLSAQHLHDFEAFGDAHPRWRLRARLEQARVCDRLTFAVYDISPRLPTTLRHAPPPPPPNAPQAQVIAYIVRNSYRRVRDEMIASWGILAFDRYLDVLEDASRSGEDLPLREVAARVRYHLDIFGEDNLLLHRAPLETPLRIALARFAFAGWVPPFEPQRADVAPLAEVVPFDAP